MLWILSKWLWNYFHWLPTQSGRIFEDCRPSFSQRLILVTLFILRQGKIVNNLAIMWWCCWYKWLVQNQQTWWHWAFDVDASLELLFQLQMHLQWPPNGSLISPSSQETLGTQHVSDPLCVLQIHTTLLCFSQAHFFLKQLQHLPFSYAIMCTWRKTNSRNWD